MINLNVVFVKVSVLKYNIVYLDVVRASVRPSVTFCFLNNSLLDFHQTLQTCSYMQDKYFRLKIKG